MLRWVQSILIFLLLGAILNVAVAWGCVLLPAIRSETLIWEVMDSPWAHSLKLKYGIHGIRNETFIAGENFGAQHIRMNGYIVVTKSNKRFNQVTIIIAEIRRSGYPFLSFQGERIVFLRPQRSPLRMPTNFLKFAESIQCLNALDFDIFRTNTSKPFLPYRPLWPGSVPNTLLYAMILWLLIRGPFLLTAMATDSAGVVCEVRVCGDSERRCQRRQPPLHRMRHPDSDQEEIALLAYHAPHPGWPFMIELLEQHRQPLADLCRRFHVARLEVFGSAANGEFDPATSDLDFLVEFGDVPPHHRFNSFFGLQRALTELFDRRVDLVEPGAMKNPWFIRRVNESRKVVYAA